MELGDSSTSRARQKKRRPRNPFDGITPQASASSSIVMKKGPWDVFINHRGCDAKHKLASSIYHTLDMMGFRAFLDEEELELGHSIPEEIKEAMRTAGLHIAIFSGRYAESPWCLAELSYMLETGTTILPVFYGVEPSDLRWVAQGKGLYAPAFSHLKKNRRYSSKMLREWKTALERVSNLSGHVLNSKNGDEGMLLKSIVNSVLKAIKKEPLEVAKHPVGMDEIVEDIEISRQEHIKREQQVEIVGIVGFGGSGKTTLATELYNRKSSSFNGSSFLHDVRDAASKNALHTKQKKLLEDLRIQTASFDNVREGKALVVDRLKNLRVLIVLDDVDHEDQLDALLPPIESLESGSLVIVTTREVDVLKKWGIASIYKIKPLQRLHAMQLFCWHAFLRPFPREDFEDLVEDWLDVCNGLPLSLKIIGGQLYGKSSKDYWYSQLDKIRRILPKEIMQRLRVSYDALDEDEQEIFLDIACFFIGERRSLATAVWDGSSWSSCEKLYNMCLVEVDDEECIRMHNHLRDLGRHIAMTHSPWRFWFQQQSIHIQKVNHIRGIKTVPTEIGELSSYEEECMANIREEILSLVPSLVGLKLLVIKGDYLYHVIDEVSRELLWLRWFQIGQRKLPARLSLKHLRVLELYEDSGGEHHLEQLWEADSDPPLQLRELVISDCHKFQRFPNSIGRLLHLKRIAITNGNNVSSLPEEFCGLKSLEHLQLCGSVMLVSLPSNFGDLRSLRYLDLSRCRNLSRLPVSFQYLMRLEYLNLQECGQLALKSQDFQNITMLEFLSLSGCVQVEELPRHIANQASLRELYLNGMKRLRELPVNFGQLSRLQKMSIGSDLLTSLPSSVGDLKSLINLSIEYCINLESLLTSLEDMPSMTDLSIVNCHKFQKFPDSIERLTRLKRIVIRSCNNFSSLPEEFCRLQLEHLQLCDCVTLVSLPTNFGDLGSLQHLDLSSCKNLRRLPVSFQYLMLLEYLNLQECGQLALKSEDFQNMTKLEFLSLSGCEQVEELPRHIANQASLKELYLNGMKRLRELPINIGQLSRLRKMSIGSDLLTSLPEGLGDLKSLTNLSIEYCINLESLPISLGDLSSLSDLSIVSCSSLESLPTSMKNLSSLKNLSVKYCSKLESLPTSLGDLSSLTDLSIACCSNLKSLPISMGNLVSLTRLSISQCRKLKWLPFSEGCYKRLEDLAIEKCPISHVDFGAAALSFAWPNLKRMSLRETEVYRISFYGHRCPRLESLSLYNNYNLTEIEGMPTRVKMLLE